MSNINEVIVAGNVTRDPEFRETDGLSLIHISEPTRPY